MDKPQALVLCNVRCFQDEQRGRLRPITLLVGENSTGKTTFLACYSVLHQVSSTPVADSLLDFNAQPFTMGSFRDIVRSRRGALGRIDEFKIGLAVAPAPDAALPPYTLFATFREQGSEPAISSLRFQFQGDSFLELRSSAAGTLYTVPGHTVEVDNPFHLAFFVLELATNAAQGPQQLPTLQPVVSYLNNLSTSIERPKRLIGPPHLPELIPVAPLRSKPERS